ncbi:MAG: fused MFS/spermidine synthase, partial [Rhodospirillaceae bacterium]|nr:fused MFS/spermidine synthase [Rhodospirillaceae bacterium]
IVAACLVYPWVFRPLALMDLALGAILAAAVLLAAPLIILSAMNPLLVALGRAAEGPPRPSRRGAAAGRGAGGDAGAGRVFFISTLGSVAGVLATAFLLIPHLSNFRGLLLLALVLGACAALGGALAPLPRPHRLRLAAVAGTGLAAAALLFALAPAYLGKDRDIVAGGLNFRIVAEYGSVYGNLKVVDLWEPGKPQNFIRLFLNDGLIQNRLLPEGTSFSEYTYALDRLAAAFVPQAKRALVLGLGAGAVPRMLTARGIAVEVVEINPDMLRAIRTQVPGTVDPLPYTVHIADARSFVHGCAGGYDVIIVDLFHGDGTPDYLQTADFFRDLRRCLAPRGAVVMNTFFAVGQDAGYTPLLATIRAAFPRLVRFTPQPGPGDFEVNSYLVALDDAPLPEGVDLGGVIPTYQESLAETMRRGRRVRDDEIQGVPVATDEFNIQSVLSAPGFMLYRAAVVRQLPPQLLVN